MIAGPGAVCCAGTFAVGAVAADAPPASDKDIPATPNAGKAVRRRLRFEAFFACAIVGPPKAANKS